ncbi:hypothetical protein COOONC_06260 [Cooperia oncophora]
MGGFSSGFYTSLLSLAPRYTSTLSAMSLFVGVVARLSTPPLVGFIIKTILFTIIAVANVFSGTIFAIFGSGDVQDWGNDDLPEKEKSMERLDEIVLIESKFM